LFCLRQWSLKENSDIKYGKYVIPADLGGLDDELIDAIRILEYMEGRELMMVIEKSKLFIKSYFWRNRGRRKRRKKRRNRRRKKRNRRRNKSRKKRTINKTDNGTVKKGEKLNEYIIDLLTNEKLFIYLFIIYIYIISIFLFKKVKKLLFERINKIMKYVSLKYYIHFYLSFN